jgi:hypothetical protein
VRAAAAAAGAVLACAVGFGLVAGADGAPPSGAAAALHGRIQQGPWYDASGTPSWTKLRYPVELRDASGRVVASVVPDEWGEFRFGHVGRGTWTFAFTYDSLLDPVQTHRTYTRSLTWSDNRDAWEVLVDIDPYTNTPSYERATLYERCPAAVAPGRGCKR